jgi:hypothetical protein
MAQSDSSPIEAVDTAEWKEKRRQYIPLWRSARSADSALGCRYYSAENPRSNPNFSRDYALPPDSDQDYGALVLWNPNEQANVAFFVFPRSLSGGGGKVAPDVFGCCSGHTGGLEVEFKSTPRSDMAGIFGPYLVWGLGFGFRRSRGGMRRRGYGQGAIAIGYMIHALSFDYELPFRN